MKSKENIVFLWCFAQFTLSLQIEITFKTNLEKVQQFLLDFGKQAGVEAFKDPAGNIVFRKAATPGMENRKGIIL